MLESTSRNSSQDRTARLADGQSGAVKADPPKDIPGPKRGDGDRASEHNAALHAAPKSASYVLAQNLLTSVGRSLGTATRGSDEPPPPEPKDITGTTRG